MNNYQSIPFKDEDGKDIEYVEVTLVHITYRWTQEKMQY